MISRDHGSAATADSAVSESSALEIGSGVGVTPAMVAAPTVLPKRNSSNDSALLDGNHSNGSLTVTKSAMNDLAAPVRPHGVQVLPLSLAVATAPRIEDFHVGKIFDSPSSTHAVAPTAVHEHEESYIPVALAKAHLAKVVADMHTMKDEQAATIATIMERYKAIEHETQLHYESLVCDLKAKAKRKIHSEQHKCEALEAASAAQHAMAQQAQQRLVAQHEHATTEHQQQIERCRAQLETHLQAHEDAMAHCHVVVAIEMRRLTATNDAAIATALRALRNELLMRYEDAKSESLRTVQHLTALRSELLVKDKAFVRRIQQLQSHSEVERETRVCVSAVVNRIVDSAQHDAMQRTTDGLMTQLDTLARSVQDATQRERTLEQQLTAARLHMAQIERAAVADTIELMLQTLELQHSSSSSAAPAPAKEPVRTLTTATVATQIALRSTAATAVQTERGDALLEDPTRSPTQLHERKNAHDLEVLLTKTELEAQRTSLDALVATKRAAKDAIKRWLAAFAVEHGHEPTLEDKTAVQALYVQFKTAEDACVNQKAAIAALTMRQQALVVENENETLAQSLAVHDARVVPHSDGAQRDAVVAALQLELEQLRCELTSVQLANDAAATAIGKQRTDRTDAVVGVETRDVSTDDDDERQQQLVCAYEDHERQLHLLREQHTRLTLAAEQQRLELQHTIEQLTAAIDARKAEKATLETQIEQLRLHLELMDVHHHDGGSEDEDEEDEGARGSARHRAAVVKKDEEAPAMRESDGKAVDVRRMSSHLFFDDEEAVESASSEDGDKDDDDTAIDECADAKDAENVDEDAPIESPRASADAAANESIVALVRTAIEQGKAQFNKGDKSACFQTYVRASEACVDALKRLHAPQRDDVVAIKQALSDATRVPAARGSMVLRKQLDALLVDCAQRLRDRNASVHAAQQRRALEHAIAARARAVKTPSSSASMATTRATPSTPTQAQASKKTRTAHHTKATPTDDNDADNDADDNDSSTSNRIERMPKATAPPSSNSKANDELKQKLKTLDAKAKVDKVKITQLEAALFKAETQLSSSSSSSSAAGSGGAANAAALERKVAELDKKHKLALADTEKRLKREITTLTTQLQAAQTLSSQLQEQQAVSQRELTALGSKAAQLTDLQDQFVTLQQQAARATDLESELVASKSDLTKLEASYKTEQALRKKLYNQIEDMKGKIRVYARCRPMSSSELERGCASCVTFTDEFSLELAAARAGAPSKPFAYDQVFSPASTQAQVFDDTKNLIQSALDGYNVCIFAYGQTGSGKTFTMTGSDALPGLTPRTIAHLFALADEARANCTITFHATMLELYNDTLIDLVALVDGGGGSANSHQATKLEIKKNDKGLVYVQHAMSKACVTPQQTLKLFDAANKKRQVGSTKMNAESSRSHSVFAIVIESFNHTTKATTTGKLSLVDLAGSERAGKTGATAERLKEAQSINKSLSALGDVISALSTNEKFIPYRNNKLTQLMQDSLGGNAKTLMFVNISPADYNQEETQTSLTYASRVKLITNSANKNAESELVNRLKGIIKQLRAGKTDVDLDGVIE